MRFRSKRKVQAKLINKALTLTSILGCIVAFSIISRITLLAHAETTCSGNKITIPSAEKKLLPLGETWGRPGTCITPKKIVLHVTAGPAGQTLEDLYNKLSDNISSNTEGVSINFAVDESGRIMQFVEMYDTMSETTRGVQSYNDEQISIEMMSPKNFQSKVDMPQAQYTATVNLVKALMKQYNIPIGDKEYDWVSNTDAYNPNSGSGVFGHYQLNPNNKTDPGTGIMRDMRSEIKSGTTSTNPQTGVSTGSGTSSCVITKVGTPQGPIPPLPAGCIGSGTTDPGNNGGGSGTHPTAPTVPDGNYAKAIFDKFGITVEGSWANVNGPKIIWEKLWDVSNTKFPALIKGATVASINGGSITYGSTANLRSTIENETLFKVILLHELGHVLRRSGTNPEAGVAEHINAFSAEGALTAYSDNPACAGSSGDEATRINEDYAEMITYYLNPGVTEMTNCSRNIVPFANGAHPHHYAVVQSVLGTY